MTSAVAAVAPVPAAELGPCVFVEGKGLDGFAEALAQRLGAVYVRFSDLPPNTTPANAAAHYFGPLALALTQYRPIVCRNTWLAHDADKLLGAGRRRMLERAALALGLKIVIANDEPVPFLLPWCNMTEPDVNFFLRELLDYRHVNRGPGSGAWRPGRSILLVGDRPNSAKHGDLKHRLPFFSKHAGGCSLWLAEQLEAADVSESELYWINGYDMEGTPTDATFLKALQPKRVVALGHQAGRWCSDHAGLTPYEFSIVRHPNYWKRFGNNEPYPLLEVLR